MTFEEVVGAVQARLGDRVRVEQLGGEASTCCGVLRPGVGFEEERQGRDFPVDAEADADGAWTFRVAPYAYWFRLHPETVRHAHEEPDGRYLRIELVEGSATVITLL
jgi:hypothetical protein